MRALWMLIFLSALVTNVAADEVYLKNGDKITGNIILDSTTRLIIETEAMGEIRIDRAHIKDYKTDLELEAEPEEKDDDVQWVRKIMIGFSDSGGNTDEGEGTAEIKVHRKTDHDEATFKYSAFVETDDDRLAKRKFYGLMRYAHSFGEDMKWYQFGKVEANQDTTTNVRYRVTPVYGLGYWFQDEDNLKLMVEGAFGWENTHYDDGTRSESEVVFTPRGYFEKTFTNGLKLSEDVTLYPSLEETGEFRLRSETELSGKITERLSWMVQFLDEYDSDPTAGRKKNDYELTTGLEYEF